MTLGYRAENPRVSLDYYIEARYTVKPRFTGPLGGKEKGPVNRKAR